MTNEQQEQYRNGALVVGAETDSQEELERAKRGLPCQAEYAASYVDPMVVLEVKDEGAYPLHPIDEDDLVYLDDDFTTIELQSYDPKAEKMEEKPAPKPVAPTTAERMLEFWYLFTTGGRLKHAGIKPGEEGQASGDEMAAAALYVEEVPMFWEKNMKPILFHKLDGNPWQFWYGPETRSYAAALFESFKVALKDQLAVKPFVVGGTKPVAPDHLESADLANDELRRTLKRRVA